MTPSEALKYPNSVTQVSEKSQMLWYLTFGAVVKNGRPFSVFFHYFHDDNKSIQPSCKHIFASTFLHLFPAPVCIRTLFPSLFFDKKSDFPFFRQFPSHPSIHYPWHTALPHILDTKTTHHHRNQTKDASSCWSCRKLLQNDFRPTNKIWDHLGSNKGEIVFFNSRNI